MVFQQKGLSVNAVEAFETYSRVIIEHVKGQSGDFYKATEFEELGANDILYLQNQAPFWYEIPPQEPEPAFVFCSR